MELDQNETNRLLSDLEKGQEGVLDKPDGVHSIEIKDLQELIKKVEKLFRVAVNPHNL